MVRLADDLKFVNNYVEIQKELLKDRLQVIYEIDSEALSAMVPSMFVQPLIENAIKHGISDRAEGGRICVRARRDNGYVEVTVADNGKGIAPSDEMQMRNANQPSGIGLNNLRARLNQFYPGDHSMRILAVPEAGFTVSISIPYEEVAENEHSSRDRR